MLTELHLEWGIQQIGDELSRGPALSASHQQKTPRQAFARRGVIDVMISFVRLVLHVIRSPAANTVSAGGEEPIGTDASVQQVSCGNSFWGRDIA